MQKIIYGKHVFNANIILACILSIYLDLQLILIQSPIMHSNNIYIYIYN